MRLRDHCGMSERSAQRYMQVSRSGLKTATVADLGIRAAADAVGKKSPAKPPPNMEWMAEALLSFFVMLVNWAGKSPDTRRKMCLDVVEPFMNHAEEGERLAAVWLKHTKAIEAEIAANWPHAARTDT